MKESCYFRVAYLLRSMSLTCKFENRIEHGLPVPAAATHRMLEAHFEVVKVRAAGKRLRLQQTIDEAPRELSCRPDAFSCSVGKKHGRFLARILLVGLSLFIPRTPARGTDGPLPPSNLKCEYLSNPIGIDVLQPRFAWTLSHTARGEKQTAYEVLVASSLDTLDDGRADQWDSGRLESDNSIQVVYAGKPLLSGRIYYWKVRYWDSEGRPSPYSAPAQFEMGLLSRTEWKGQWISGNTLRKAFRAAKTISRARVYVTTLGYYELHLNGVRVGENVLDPAWTDFRKRILYSTYDVTSMLHSGENAVGVLLGGGWATLGTGMLGGKPYYDHPALLLQLNIEFEDGTQTSLESDGSWKMMRGPIVSDNVYDGEMYDARMELAGWDRADFNDSEWKEAQVADGSSGILSAQMMPPIRVISSVTPVRMVSPKPGIFVFDMGQNISGWARLRVTGPAGTEVTLRFGEVAYSDGSLDTANLRQAKQREVYILSGNGEEVYEPHFTYHGFRYVEVSGFPGTPDMDSIVARVVHTSVKTTGNFATSKPILNDIQRLVWWTQLTNLFSIPTDCDQRDERQGWMGDAQLSAEEAMMNFDMAAFYTNFIREIRDELGPDGSLPETVPEKFGHRPADPGWGTAYPLICWYMWEQYGDRRILEENYQGLQKYLDFLQRRAPDYVLRFNFNGDWIATVETPGEVISDAYYFYDITVLRKIAAVLGKSSDERQYENLAGRVKDAFNQNFFNVKAGYYGNGTQTANAMALFLRLVPENEIGRVSFYLERDILD